MEIRKATKKDCDQLFELWKELGQTHSKSSFTFISPINPHS